MSHCKTSGQQRQKSNFLVGLPGKRKQRRPHITYCLTLRVFLSTRIPDVDDHVDHDIPTLIVGLTADFSFE